MIYNTDRRPKGITLFKLQKATTGFKAPENLGDVVPLMDAASGDAKQWRPDLTTSQSWTFNSSIPQAPLASGVSASNHIRRNPIRLTYEAMVTDTPLVPFGTLGGLPGIRRADALWASLRAMYESRSFVAVIAPVAVIQVALIENLTLNRTADDGSAYFFSIDVVEQRIFELQLLPNIEDERAKLGAALTTSGGIVIGGF